MSQGFLKTDEECKVHGLPGVSQCHRDFGKPMKSVKYTDFRQCHSVTGIFEEDKRFEKKWFKKQFSKNDIIIIIIIIAITKYYYCYH